MQVTEHTTQAPDKERAETSTRRHAWINSVVALVSTFVSAIGALLSVFIIKSPRSSLTELFSTGQRLSFFIGAILVLAVIIVIIATFRTRQNRSVILLKERLAEIYLSALRKSSLNPQLESAARHD